MTYYKANMCLTSNDIQHFGVPGMKWGVRKDRNSLAQSLRFRKSRENEGNKRVFTEDQVRKRQNIKRVLKIAGGTAAIGAVAYLGYRNYKGNNAILAIGNVAANQLKKKASDYYMQGENTIGNAFSIQNNAYKNNRSLTDSEKNYVNYANSAYDNAVKNYKKYNNAADNLRKDIKMNALQKVLTPQKYTTEKVEDAIYKHY